MNINKIKLGCPAVPYELEISLDNGKMVYFRYRWECLTIEISKNATTDIMDAVNEKLLYEEYLPHCDLEIAKEHLIIAGFSINDTEYIGF